MKTYAEEIYWQKYQAYFPTELRCTGVEISEPFFRKLKSEKTLVLLENCDHLPIEEPGLTQLREEVTGYLHGLAGGPGR